MPEQGNGRGDGAPAPVPPALPRGAAERPAIPQPQLPPERRRLRFSFRHLDTANAKFQLDDCNAHFLRESVARIRDYSNWSVEDFCDQNNHEHRHVIWFPDTTEPNGFEGVGLDADQLAYHEAWQFQVRQDEGWRIHGILIDDTFYIIWLDPNHQLYEVQPRHD